MKKVLALLIVVTLMAVGCAAYAADGGHGGSTVNTPVLAQPVNDVPASVLETFFGDDVEVRPLLPTPTTTVPAAVMSAVETQLNSLVADFDVNVEVTPVVLPVLAAEVEFSAAGTANVAFGSNKSGLTESLFGSDAVNWDEVDLFLLKNNNELSDALDFAIMEEGDDVYFGFEIEDDEDYILSSARRASTTVNIEPVLVRAVEIGQPSNSSSGGCDAGFSGVAALLALAGGVLLCRKSRG
ncbi:MAG: hypothetical protein LBQ58_06230 [Synergistaceae bacterium]|nr:hypothetical protein [Synergistaceae bacterium]